MQGKFPNDGCDDAADDDLPRTSAVTLLAMTVRRSIGYRDRTARTGSFAVIFTAPFT
jgi:hypothetical protein